MSEENKFVPYDSTHRLHRLLLVVTIVNQGQSQAVIALNQKCDGTVCFVCSGYGTATKEMMPTYSKGEFKKDVVFSVLREDGWPKYKEEMKQRFGVSKMAKGIAYCSPIQSVAGVSIYKFLSNLRVFEKPLRKSKKGRKEKAK